LNVGPAAEQCSGEKSSVEMNKVRRTRLALTATSACHTRWSYHVSVHHRDHFRPAVTFIIRETDHFLQRTNHATT